MTQAAQEIASRLGEYRRFKSHEEPTVEATSEKTCTVKATKYKPHSGEPYRITLFDTIGLSDVDEVISQKQAEIDELISIKQRMESEMLKFVKPASGQSEPTKI